MTNHAVAPDRPRRRGAAARAVSGGIGRILRTGRARIRAVAAAGCAVTLTVLVLSIALPDPAAFLTMRVVIHTVLVLAAIVGVRTALRTRGHDRTWRWLLAAALTLTAAGGVAATVSGAEAAPLPTLPTMSAVHLMFLVPTMLGLAALLFYPTDPPDPTVARLGARWWTATILDSAIAVGSVFLLAWILVLRDTIRAATGDIETLVIPLVLVAGNVMLVCAVLLLAIFRRARSARGLGLLAVGLTTFSLSFLAYFYSVAASVRHLPHAAEVGWLVGGWCVLLSYLLPVAPRPGPAPAGTVLARLRGGRWWRAVLPLLPLVLAGLAALIHMLVAGHVVVVEVCGMFALLLLGMIRQLVVLGDNFDLLRRLESSERRLHHQAFHDPLTGLANRALFNDRLTTALAHQARDRRPIAVLFCDLDDFKHVNDTLGHAAGDELLQVTAARLRRAVRASDTVARFGGDEFAILLQAGGEDPAQAGSRVVMAVRAPVSLADTRYTVRVSVGLVVANAAEGLSAETLLHRADVAMYEAKSAGKGGLTIYRPRMSDPATDASLRAALAWALHGDPAGGRLFPRYRPIIDLRTRRPAACQAQLRWSHPVLGDLPAASVLPAAEHVGLAPALDLAILRLVCQDLPRLRGSPTPPPVHIPVSLTTTVPTPLGTRAHEAVRAGSVRPGEIVFDLTDTAHAPDPATAGAALARLHDQGFPLALTDFGARGVNPDTLREFPVDLVALAPGLIMEWTAPDLTDRDVLIRDAYLGLLRTLGIAILAPDVTDERTARAAAALGVSLATGDLFDAPHLADESGPGPESGPADRSADGSGPLDSVDSLDRAPGRRLTREAQSWSTAVTRTTTTAPASSEAARSISALMPQS